MAPTIASPIPQQHVANRPTRKDIANLQLHEEGRSTPLPQYEKTQSMPFALTLQEDKSNPGQFQLVVNIDPDNKRTGSSKPKPATSKKLYANLQSMPSLGYDVSNLYQTRKSSPPTSPHNEKQGWSDLDAIPSDFLQKVVPDWQVTFDRKDSTASTQSRKLADIKARIKKSGKGFVVRLLKGSSSDSNEVAEVHLGHDEVDAGTVLHELDAEPCAELDAMDPIVVSPVPEQTATDNHPNVFEIGTSNEPGIQRNLTQVPAGSGGRQIVNGARNDRSQSLSTTEESFSDAETLAQDVRSIADTVDDDQTDLEPFSRNSSLVPSRTASVSSIIKTPTRGLSVVGPVTRTGKADRTRKVLIGGRAHLGRSDARRSFKRCPPHPSIVNSAPVNDILEPKVEPNKEQQLRRDSQSSDDLSESSHIESIIHRTAQNETRVGKPDGKRMLAEEKAVSVGQKVRLSLQTDVPRPKSANVSPISKRKRSPHIHKRRQSTSPVEKDYQQQRTPSPAWLEVDPSDDLRDALEKAFGSVSEDLNRAPDPIPVPVPRIEEPPKHVETGEIQLPPGLEIRSTPVNQRSPFLTFWGLALNALVERAFEGLHLLQERYGREPRIPTNHVRVRWTCPCGEALYDDFIEQRPGAARLLEAYLNRPRTHTPTSPSGRTSTSSTMSSVFDSVSRASTLATPASTYGGASPWGKSGDSSKYSPTKLRSHNPFSVRIGGYPEEQWLLTCANEGRFTPKIVHLDVNSGKIKSDKDLALALRDHYDRLNQKWLNWAKLRGLTTIEFVQFEVHRNRFADIRASPSMPPAQASTSDKTPSTHPYSFEPNDLMPPVGSTYLLHLFKHPSDYDNELITYLRSPKRRERLEYGMGWGINLVEGFLAQKVWSCLMVGFGIGSALFATLWTVKKGDVQGAFGVAGWIVTLAGLILGGLQAWLD
ncbi:hypothetical protein BDV96DRAFT_603485 [Lophiotrema nucula]|uniref:Uncharacterized protein n=1 Tax=Lophiotrema nucula TaxID=690887 RepID=A0A6A5YWD1_9PLEO|nr:hypothetical protein BDV96DRAFT_603485 [Lophiotrema nucula]